MQNALCPSVLRISSNVGALPTDTIPAAERLQLLYGRTLRAAAGMSLLNPVADMLTGVQTPSRTV
jgi:hypothetical protein